MIMKINDRNMKDILDELSKVVSDAIGLENIVGYYTKKTYSFKSDVLTITLSYHEDPQREYYDLKQIKSDAYNAAQSIFGVFALQDYKEQVDVTKDEMYVNIIFKFTVDELEKVKVVYDRLFTEGSSKLLTYSQFINESSKNGVELGNYEFAYRCDEEENADELMEITHYDEFANNDYSIQDDYFGSTVKIVNTDEMLPHLFGNKPEESEIEYCALNTVLNIAFILDKSGYHWIYELLTN
jgi:hypothetical protein